MPTYLYQVILADDIEGPQFEFAQSIKDPPLTIHPVTGHKVKRIISPPNIIAKHTPGKERKILDNNYLKSKGFTKFQKDKLTGDYHCVTE